MAGLHAIHIGTHDHHTQPTPHTVYRIDIQGSVRAWSVWHRYSEFVDLDAELRREAGDPPPAQLPPKHSWSLRRTFNQDALVAERIQGLDQYLRAILASKDSRWLDSHAFRNFLGMPVSKHIQPADPNEPSIAFTSSSWLDAHTDVVASVRDIRSDINKRDALAQRGELGPSGSANTQAKKKLAVLLRRLDLLAHALEPLSRSGMSSGELHRRTEMVARLQDDCEKLAQMLVAARNYTPSSQSKSASDPRAELLAQPSAPTRLVGRVFGAAAAAQETEATRPLDNQSLLQLQEQQVHQQDEQLEELTAVLRRQKQIGIVIGDEIQKQITMLDEFDADLDQFGNKMYKAKKNLNRLDG